MLLYTNQKISNILKRINILVAKGIYHVNNSPPKKAGL